MKGLGFVLIVAAVAMGAFAMTSGTSRGALMGGAGVLLLTGLILLLAAAFVESKKKSFMTQMQQMNTAGAASMTGQTTSVDVEAMMGLDANDVLKSVMEAQQQAGGDPQAMAKLLQDKFGGQSVVVNGSTNTSFDLSSQTLGSLSSSNPSNDMLNQLIKLRDSGAISDEQFEQQKDRLIDS